LFAAFAAKIGGDDKASKAFLQQMSKSALYGKVNYSGTHQLLRKHVKHKVVGKAVSPHAYVMTAMASLLEASRATGVLASAEFLWLKRVDRNLWYMLSSVGRQTPFPEVGGVFAHWIVEKKLRRPLKVPMVNEAVVALDLAIKDILYNPDED
jgi:intracellular multiplication protein IcmP